MSDRQEAAARLRDWLGFMRANESDWDNGQPDGPERMHADDIDTLLTPPLQSEVQEAVDDLDCFPTPESETCPNRDCEKCHSDALATITAALTSASETEAAFIELMEADDPEPPTPSDTDLDRFLDMKQVLNAWRERQALKAAHKARYDALTNRKNSEKE